MKKVIKINTKNRNTIYNKNKCYLDLNTKNKIVGGEIIEKIKKLLSDDSFVKSSNYKKQTIFYQNHKVIIKKTKKYEEKIP